VAAAEVDLAIISRETLESTICGKLKDVTEKFEVYELLRQVQLLRGLNDAILNDMISVLEPMEYR
jgi:hypothetical protein